MNKIVLTKYILCFVVACCCLLFSAQSNAQAVSFSNSTVVNVGDTAYITTIITDTIGGPPSVGIPVEYTITGTHPLSPTVINTDTNGEATYTYVTTTSGLDNFTTDVNNGLFPYSGTITINALPSLITFVGNQTLDLGDPHSSTITVTDGSGTPIPNEPVTYTITGANPSTGTLTTGPNGETILNYTPTNLGMDMITFTTTDGATLTYTVTTVDTAPTTLITFMGGQTVYPGNPHTVTTTVTDASGNPLPNEPITYTITGANPTTGTVTTDSSGDAIINYTPTNPGADMITVTSADGTTSSYTVSTVNPNNLFFTFIPGTATAGEPYSMTLVVTDSNGNPVPNAPVTYTVGGTNSFTSTATTDANGQAVLTYTPTSSGTDSFTVMVGGTSQSINITVGQGACPDCATGLVSMQACDDSDPCTTNDMETILECDGSVCVPCRGVTTDCSNSTTSIVNCDDGDACTTNDVQTISDCDSSICVPCQGTLLDCNSGTTTIVACDDGDACTINDMQEVACDGSICVPCQGTLQDCTNGTTTVVTCDDNDPCTINDTQEVACDGTVCVPCQGTLQDCTNGTTTVVTCDDNDPCTINDTQEVACDGTVCVPCQGTLQDCTNGTTTVVTCDDNNPCTINDVQEIACDGSICVPCQGVAQGCGGGTAVVSCDDGDPCTLNDIQEIACNGSICVPCQGVAPSCEENVLDFTDNGIDWTNNALSGTYTVAGITYTISIDDSDNILYADNYEGPSTKESGSGIRIGIDPHDLNDKVTITYDLSQTVDFVAFKIRDFDLKNYGAGSSNQQEAVCVYGYLDPASGAGAPTEILPVITSYDGHVDIDGNCAEATANSSQSGKEESVWVEFTECVDRVVIEYGSGANSPTNDPSYSKIYIADEFGFVTKSCNPSCITLTCDDGIVQSCDDGNPLTINDVETVLTCGGAVCVPCAGTPAVCDENKLDFNNNGIDWHTNAMSGSHTVGTQTFDINIADADGILQDTYENYAGISVGIEPHNVNDKLIVTYDLSEISSNVIFDIVDLDYKDGNSKQQEAVCVYGFLGGNQTQILPTITSLNGSVAINGNCAEATTNSAISGKDESILVSFTDCIDKIVIEYGTGSNSPVNDPSYSKIHIGKHLGFSAFTCENACVVDCGVGSGAGDDDNDGVCNPDDVCPGFDDNADADGDGIPDGCETCSDYDLDFSHGNNWVTNSTSGSYTVGEQTFDILISDNDNILHDTYESHKGIMIGIDPHDTNDEIVTSYELSEVSNHVVFDIVDLDRKDGNSKQQEAVCVYGLLGNSPTEILPLITSLDGSVAINGNCAEATTNSAVSGKDESVLVTFNQCIDKIIIVYGTGSDSPTEHPTYSKIYIGEQYGIQTEVCQDACVVDCGVGDDDNDGVCNVDDVCPGFNDNIDADGDGIPDGCETCMDYALDFKEDGNHWTTDALSGSYSDGAQTFDISIADADNILQDTKEAYSGIMLGIDPHNVNDEVVACYNLSEVSNHVIFDIVDLDKKDGSSKQQEKVCVYGLLGADQTQILPTITSLDGSVAINGNCAEATSNSAVSGDYESVLVEFTECIDKIVIVYGTGSDSPTNDPTYSKIYIGKHRGIQTEVCQDACTVVSCGASGDNDNDGICNDVDVCPGFDDNIDLDNNGIPDGCDAAVCDTPPVINMPVFITCTNGNVTIRPNANITSSCASDNGSYLWGAGEQTNTLTVTEAGVYTFTVTDCDGCAASGSVTVTAGEICSGLQGLALITINDDNVTLQNQSVRGSVIGNDVNPYAYNLTVNLVSEPLHGRLFFYPSGQYEYIPDAGYIGVDEFEYQICDEDLECINATTTITTTSVLFDPLVLNNDDGLGEVGIGIGLVHNNSNGLLKSAATTWTGNLLVNDATFNGASMIVSTTPVTMPQHGSVTLHADGTYEYAPVDGYLGKDMFEYEVCTDIAPIVCGTAKMYITIIEDMNGMPFGGDDFFAVEENGQIAGDVTLNDYDTDGEALTYSAYNEDGVAANVISEQGANVSLNADGTFTYAASNGFVGPDYFCYMMTDASGNTAKATVNLLVQRTHAKLDLQVYLAGALGTGINMNTNLNDRGLLPGQTPASNIATPNPAGQPYHIAPWNYNGTEGANWTDANYEAIEAQYDAAVVDWVLVNFRTDAEANTLIGRSAALLLNDGSVVFPESTLPLADLATNALYILVEHRNHIGAMSPAAVNINSLGELALDLRNKDSYANTGIGQSLLPTGVWAMPAGDGSQTTDPNGYDINGNDKTIWVEENGKFDQYLRADYNLDGDVNGGDKVIWYDNNGNFSSIPK